MNDQQRISEKASKSMIQDETPCPFCGRSWINVRVPKMFPNMDPFICKCGAQFVEGCPDGDSY
jgi:hypothetical protein